MKINLKTNLFIKIITIIYTILLAVSLYLEIDHIEIAGTENDIFLVFLYASYLLMLVYLIVILKTLKEQKTIKTAFIIFTCLEVVKIIFPFMPLQVHHDYYAIALQTFSAVIVMYLVLQTFTIQNRYIAIPYRLFGGALAVSVIAFFYLTSSSPKPSAAIADSPIKDYLDILKILAPIAALYILQHVDLFLKENKGENVAVSN